MASRDPGQATGSRPARRARRRRTPGAPPSAKPVISAMSVVATTFGIGRQDQPPGDRERRQGRDERDGPRSSAASARTRRSRRRSRAPSNEEARSPARSSLCRPRLRAPPGCAGPSRARIGGDRRAGAEDARDLGGEVPAAREDLAHRAIGDHARRRPAARRAGRTSRRTRRRGWRRAPPSPRRREPLQPIRELLLARPVHAARRLVEADEAGRRPSGAASGHHDRQGQALALAAGEVARVAAGRPTRGRPSAAPPRPPGPAAPLPPARG